MNYQIRLYEILRLKFEDKDAKEVVEILDKKVDERLDDKMKHLDDKLKHLATKEDLATTREQLSKEFTRNIYTVSVGQFFAIVGAIVSLMLLLRK